MNSGYSMKEINDMSEIFKVLSNEVRLCILLNLFKNGEKRVSDLQDCSGSSQSFVSQQLAKLKALGIISSRKEGKEVYYYIENNKIKKILESINLS